MSGPNSRFIYAQQLMAIGRYEEATDELLWCLDHRMEVASEVSAIWVAFVPRMLVEAGIHWAPAAEALRERSDKAEGRLLRPGGCRGSQQDTCRLDASLVEAAAEALDDRERLFVLYRSLEGRGVEGEALLKDLWPSVFDFLWERGQYGEIAIRGVATSRRLHQQRVVLRLFEKRGNREKVAARLPAFIETYGRFFAALLAVGKRDEAIRLIEDVAVEESRWQPRLMGELAKHAVEMGRLGIARMVLDQAPGESPEGKVPNSKKPAQSVHP